MLGSANSGQVERLLLSVNRMAFKVTMRMESNWGGSVPQRGGMMAGQNNNNSNKIKLAM